MYQTPNYDTVYNASERLMSISLDEAEKSRLMDNPRLVLQELNAPIPEGVEVQVHENTPDTFHLVFPPDPNQELTDESLGAVAGGKTAGSVGSAGSGSTASCVGICWGCASSAGTAGTAGSGG